MASTRRAGGSAPPAPTAPAYPLGPQIARREEWVDLPQSSYPGFKIRLWVNYPQRLYLTIVDPAVGPEPTKEALQRVILEHNHWRDYEGNEYPQPGDEDFWTSIPDELLAILIVMIKQVPYQLPNSLRPTSRTSGGTSSPPPTTPASSSPGS